MRTDSSSDTSGRGMANCAGRKGAGDLALVSGLSDFGREYATLPKGSAAHGLPSILGKGCDNDMEDKLRVSVICEGAMGLGRFRRRGRFRRGSI